jgi:hypothetical protein
MAVRLFRKRVRRAQFDERLQSGDRRILADAKALPAGAAQ